MEEVIVKSEMEVKEEPTEQTEQIRFIDLFCGIGGFHQAFQNLNITSKCVFACDIDEHCRSVYKKNYGIEPEKDINQVKIEDIPCFDVLCGGFPCQPFSKAGHQKGFQDERGNLFFTICKIVVYHRPKYMILENVKNLESHDKGNTWKVIKQKIDEIGYYTYEHPLTLNALMFGVPQNRERVIILCKRKDLGELLPFPKKLKLDKKKLNVSLKSIIKETESKDNQKYKIEGKIKQVEIVWNQFIQLLLENKISMPKFPIWTDWWDGDGEAEGKEEEAKGEGKGNTKKTKEQKEKFLKKYENWIGKNREFWKHNQNILEPWLKESRRNPKWKGSVRKLEWQAGDLEKGDSLSSVLWSTRSSGIRVKRLDYSPTLIAMTSMIPIYGPESRYFSPKELLRLQSFNENFILHTNDKVSYKQIGNSVNVCMIQKSLELLLFNKNIFN
jgi:DNA (cytosine-5)-methyltransferase 1